MSWYKKARDLGILQKFMEEARKEKQQAIALSNETGDQSVQLSNKDGSLGAMVNKSGKVPGKWQMSRFDDRGFSSDGTYNTKEEAMIQAFSEGFIIQKDLISEFNKDPKFSEGNEYTRALQIANRFGGTPGFEVLDAYKEGGLQAARDKAQEIENRSQGQQL